MIVVADTTPLNYLILIDEIELLPAIYRAVLIPHEVHAELRRPQSPPAVRAWAANLPAWCEARSAPTLDAALNGLDDGEREAIQLALDTGVDTLLMDESEGRREALRRHLKVTGTVAVLEKASDCGLIDFRSTLERLERTNFAFQPAFATSSSSAILEGHTKNAGPIITRPTAAQLEGCIALH